MKKNSWLIFFLSAIGMLTILGFACDRAQNDQSGVAIKKTLNSDPHVAAKMEPHVACTSDSDCVAVKAGCCGCKQGGKQITISAHAVSGWNDQLKKSCVDRMCAQMISNDPSCKMKPRCRDNKCTLE